MSYRILAWGIIGLIGGILISNLTFAEKNDEIVIADAEQPGFALVYIADRKGFFKEEGIDVRYKKFSAGRDALAELVNGGSDIALCLETPTVINAYEGEDFKILTSLHHSHINTGIIGNKAKGIYKPKDLVGKTIAVPKGTNADYFLRSFLTENGINKANLKIVYDSVDGVKLGYENKKYDAISIWNVPIYLSLFPGNVKDSSVFYSDIYAEYSVVVGSPGFLQRENGELAYRFIKALAKAEKFYNYNEEESFSIISSALPENSRPLDDYYGKYSTIRLMLDNGLLDVLEREAIFYRKEGVYEKSLPNMRWFIDTKFLDLVRPESVTII